MAENLFYCWFSAMHSRVDIALSVSPSTSQQHCLTAAEAMRARIDEIEHLANCFDPHSELSRYNSGLLARHQLAPELQTILDLADRWRAETHGLFNPEFAATAQTQPGPARRFYNLSGFLKGYALDALRPILRDVGITSALLNLGNSSILALGLQPGRTDGWQVANAAGQTFLLQDECLTTSGNDTPSRRHIVNPLTGQYVEGRRLVSVVTPTATEGEVRSIEALLSQTPLLENVIS